MQFHRHLIALIAMLFATSALAAGSSKLADANATYQQERSACLSGKSNEGRATCLREAGAALAAARSGQLKDKPDEYQKNSLMRCNALPEKDRPDCVHRMQDGTVEGSSESGGILREGVTTVPAPVDAAPAPSQ